MKQILLLLLILFLTFPSWAQERPLNTGLSNEEQYAFIGMMIEKIIENYGPPRSVAAARGVDLWQDDVVFQYTGVDFYIYIDRVWQVKFVTTHDVSIGNKKAEVILTLGETAKDMEDHILLAIDGFDWPLTLRINFNDKESVTSIFLYRPDY